VGEEVAEKEGSGWGLECAQASDVVWSGRRGNGRVGRICILPPTLLPRCMPLSICCDRGHSDALPLLCATGRAPIPQHRGHVMRPLSLDCGAPAPTASCCNCLAGHAATRSVVLLPLGAAPNHSVMECLIIHFPPLSLLKACFSRPACTPCQSKPVARRFFKQIEKKDGFATNQIN
jgi:hypothetical protein